MNGTAPALPWSSTLRVVVFSGLTVLAENTCYVLSLFNCNENVVRSMQMYREDSNTKKSRKQGQRMARIADKLEYASSEKDESRTFIET